MSGRALKGAPRLCVRASFREKEKFPGVYRGHFVFGYGRFFIGIGSEGGSSCELGCVERAERRRPLRRRLSQPGAARLCARAAFRKEEESPGVSRARHLSFLEAGGFVGVGPEEGSSWKLG
jgi:hypothetical protein